MQRLLILYASVGEGHRSAAKALEQAFLQRGNIEVRVEDALDHGSSFYRQLYVDTYLELSEKAPEIWEYFYKLADKDDAHLVKDLRIFIDRLGVTDLDKLIDSYQPEVIICTHFLPLHILARYRSQGKLDTPFYAVVTDYTGHVYWVYDEVDGYFVASEHTRNMLTYRGVAAEIQTITGIPIDPSIAEPKDQAALRQTYTLDSPPVVTLIGSGISIERVQEMVIGIQQQHIPGTLVVVAGRNAPLEEALQKLPQEPPLDLRVFGFVDFLDDMIATSDLLITKAGWLIVSEVMARHTPMVLIDPIPGQEEWNADYVVSVGAGVQVRLPAMVPTVVRSILEDTERLAMLKRHAEQSGKAQAAMTIVDYIQEHHP
jgi:processive 1,2-diacylglycerol beta-glucosyltransferase